MNTGVESKIVELSDLMALMFDEDFSKMSQEEVVDAAADYLSEQQARLWIVETAIENELGKSQTARWAELVEEALDGLGDGEELSEQQLESMMTSAKSEH